MTKTVQLIAGVLLAIICTEESAHAWWFEDDGRSWPVFAFHEYDGSDVNRQGETPDRPYWHGDDAVPLGLRWRDLEAAQTAAAAETAAEAAVEVVPAVQLPHRGRAIRRRRVVVHHPARICLPAPTAAR